MVPQIQSEMDRTVCHFGPFFVLSPPNDLEIQNFEKLKKLPGDVIILHMCTKYPDHMMHASGDMEYDRGPFFALLPP